MRISDWSSDVCSSDLLPEYGFHAGQLLDRDAAAHVLIGIEQRGAAARLQLDGHDLTREASVGDGARRPLLRLECQLVLHLARDAVAFGDVLGGDSQDRKSTRLNSSH